MESPCLFLGIFVFVKLCVAVPSNIGSFWHVTDFHYDHTYLTNGLSCNAEVDNPAPLGDYWCDSPWNLVTQTIRAMAERKADVDFILWTGDTVAHISNDNLSVSINTDVLRNLTSAIDDAFPNTPVFPTFGNHDYYPASQFPDAGNVIYNVTAELWRHWIQEEQQLDNFRKGGYYTRQLPAPASGSLRLVALNTNLYYTSDKATSGIQDPAGQFQWLRSVLTQARDHGEKVILAAHIPPGIHTPSVVQWYQEPFVQPFHDVITQFADVIKAMHFGHDHHDGFKVISDGQGTPTIPLFVAPSVTPWRYKLGPQDIGPPHNPAIRLVSYRRDTGDHTDIQQFRLDLAKSRHQINASFPLMYSFVQHYQTADVSAASLDSVVTRMSKQDGQALLDDYYRFALMGAEYKPCDQTCKERILCGFRIFNLTRFNDCVRNHADSHYIIG